MWISAGGDCASWRNRLIRQAEWLVPFLNDPAREVRQCAALGLAIKPDESAIQPLVQALSDEDGMVSSLAVNALVKIGSAAVPALIEVVKRRPAIVRPRQVEGMPPNRRVSMHCVRWQRSVIIAPFRS